MFTKYTFISILLSCFLSSISYYASAVDEFINYQGITGAINTPSANILREGTFHFNYSNQVERNNTYMDNHSFNFAVGIYDFLEVSGRNASYTDDLDLGSDLSANIKLKIPYIPKNWFSLAIGSQDLGGAANNYGAEYVVASQSFLSEQLSLSIGLSHSDSILGRMDGTFGSIRYQPYEWLQLQAEYDAQDTHLGVQFATPLKWLNNKAQFNASILLSSSNDALTDNLFYGVGFSLPITTSTNHDLLGERLIEAEVKKSSATRSAQKMTDQNESSLFAQLAAVKNNLVDFGFEDVSVGYSAQSNVYVELTNLSTFGRNRIDALGYVLGLLSEKILLDDISFNINLMQNDILTESYTGSLDTYNAFLNGAASSGVVVHNESLTEGQIISWIEGKKSNDVWFKPRITFSPDINTTLGTEYGVFDASLGLATQFELDLWSGGALYAKHINQFYETEDFRDGQVFAKSRQQSGLSGLSLHQSFKLPHGIYQMASLGRFRFDYNFIRSDTYWASLNGKHKIEFSFAKYKLSGLAPSTVSCNTDYGACRRLIDENRIDIPDINIGLIGYKYFIPNYDLLVRLDAGKFWQADKGFTAELERQFGDTTVRLRYKNTVDSYDIRNEFIALSFSLPLTPRREFNKKHVTVRGSNKFIYGVQTLIGKDHNRLTPGTGDSGNIGEHSLTNLYFNNHRSGQAYLDRHQARLKEVYLLYKNH